MVFTYYPNHIGDDGYGITTVRFLAGDTAETPYSLDDREIQYLINAETDDGYQLYNAAISACHTLALRYSQRPTSESVGDASVGYGSAGNGFRERIAYIKRTYLGGTTPAGFNIVGGRLSRFANNLEGITPSVDQDE